MKKVKKFCVALMIVLGAAGMAYGCGSDSGNSGKKPSASATKADKKTKGISKGYQKMSAHSAVEGSTAEPKGEVTNKKGEEVSGKADSSSECKFFEAMPTCVDGGKTAVVCVPNNEEELEKMGEKMEKMFEEFEGDFDDFDDFDAEDGEIDVSKLNQSMQEKFNKIMAVLEELEKMQSSVKGKWMKYPCADCKVSGGLPSFGMGDIDDDVNLSLSCGGKDIFDDDYEPGDNKDKDDKDKDDKDKDDKDKDDKDKDKDDKDKDKDDKDKDKDSNKLPDIYKLDEGKAPDSGAKKQGACKVSDEPVCDKDKVYLCTPKAEDVPKLEAAFKELWDELSKNEGNIEKILEISQKFEEKLSQIQGEWFEYKCSSCSVNTEENDVMCSGKSIFED